MRIDLSIRATAADAVMERLAHNADALAQI
jgi:hypothetical protein